MQDFSVRRDALFACLDDASKELKGTALDQTEMSTNTVSALKRLADGNFGEEMVYRGQRAHISPDRSLSRMRGKESIFKKPELPISKCLKPRKTPDYQINPHKWKKYSLSDVDISDHTNTAAAFAFLREIDEQREAQEAEDDASAAATEAKIEFKKSSKIRRCLKALEADEVPDAEVDKPKLRGSKLVMPEYVIGQKQPDKKKKSPKPLRSAGKAQKRAAGSLSLAHLQEEDDEVVVEEEEHHEVET